MRLSAFFLAAALPTAALAQERVDTILVLDGSGSMWGQIEGTAKITIAQDVVRGLLGTLPDEQALGLTVYGHRTRGDCTDIETVVAPGAGTRAAIAEAVDGISPLGKTPMTDAVIAAAEALRYTEEKATVVLVSDGVETCNPDPCAAARALEAAGIDFTAHVIGFDVGSDPAALAQMQCIAGETGGQFLTAQNADELSAALVTVAAEPPAPAPVTVTFRGIAGPDGPTITDPLVWSISGQTGQIAANQSAPSLSYDLLPGEYAVSALWPQYEEIAEATAQVTETGTVTLVFPAPPPPPVEITFVALDGRNGPRITDPLEWRFFQDGAQLGEALSGSEITGSLPRGAYRVMVTRPLDGATAEETFGVGTVNATVTLILPEYRPAATIEAPGEAFAGSVIDVIWTGPDGENDYIGAALAGAEIAAVDTFTYTREGPLLKLRVPAQPGAYELRYVLADGRKMLASVPLTVVPAVASLEAPSTGIAGATVAIGWTGPDYEGDFVTVTTPEARDGDFINYTYTREGAPLDLQLPALPGEYEVRYTMRQDGVVLARVPISVAAATASIDAPETAVAGEPLTVGWTGPDYEGDFIAVVSPEAPDGQWINYSYTRDGAPLALSMPPEPGTYEIRYTLRQDGEVLARKLITVGAVTASLDAPDTATAGETVDVTWTGPDYEGDFIAVTAPGAKDGTWINYTYTRDGTPLGLQLPPDPGTYELRYTMRQDGEVIARRAITVAAVGATLQAPETAVAGATIDVTWSGPDYEGDFIAVTAPDAKDGTWINYTYTRDGTPLGLQLPPDAGTYEIRYTMRQDGRVVARQPIAVSPVTATLSAAEASAPGAPVAVTWEGPDYEGDFIAIAEAGGRDNSWITYTYTRDGTDLTVNAPDAPGTYEIRYVMRQESRVLASQPLVVND